MFRKLKLEEVEKTPPAHLKTIIRAHLEFIGVVAPFAGTKEVISELLASVDKEGDTKKLRSILISVLGITHIWDKYNAHNEGSKNFPPGKEFNINIKLKKLSLKPPLAGPQTSPLKAGKSPKK